MPQVAARSAGFAPLSSTTPTPSWPGVNGSFGLTGQSQCAAGGARISVRGSTESEPRPNATAGVGPADVAVPDGETVTTP
jgi:hypothetical protein